MHTSCQQKKKYSYNINDKPKKFIKMYFWELFHKSEDLMVNDTKKERRN